MAHSALFCLIGFSECLKLTLAKSPEVFQKKTLFFSRLKALTMSKSEKIRKLSLLEFVEVRSL